VIFQGVGVALATLFDDGGGLDAARSAELAASLADEGMRAILVAGSTGEAATLDPAERVELVTAVRAAVPAGVPVLAGTGAPSARHATQLTASALNAGADGVLALSPPGSADLERYYGEVVAAADGAPVYGYHFPGMSAPGIPVELLPRLGELGVVGLKDSSGDPSRLVRTLEHFEGALYVGSPWLLSAAGPLGAAGAILAVANVEPALSIKAFGGDVDAQRALAATCERSSGPAGIKRLLGERGFSAVTRV
jgi:4-hydroxy-tetrahydrodipicolinate synthase